MAARKKRPSAAVKPVPDTAAAAGAFAEDLAGEALQEWIRVCAELKALGTFNAADRAIMTLHCQTWETYTAVTKLVRKFGAVIMWPNKVPGPGPFYKVQRECVLILRGTLNDLGLTPASRGFQEKEKEEPGELDF